MDDFIFAVYTEREGDYTITFPMSILMPWCLNEHDKWRLMVSFQ